MIAAAAAGAGLPSVGNIALVGASWAKDRAAAKPRAKLSPVVIKAFMGFPFRGMWRRACGPRRPRRKYTFFFGLPSSSEEDDSGCLAFPHAPLADILSTNRLTRTTHKSQEVKKRQGGPVMAKRMKKSRFSISQIENLPAMESRPFRGADRPGLVISVSQSRSRPADKTLRTSRG